MSTAAGESMGMRSWTSTWVLYYRIRGGKIAEVQNVAGDQHAADLFFWEVWGESLKPLPDRLSGT
jgi:hypothetical protein